MGKLLDEFRVRVAIEKDKIEEEQRQGIKRPVNGVGIVIAIVLIGLVIGGLILMATLESGQLAFFGIIGICLFGFFKGLMR